MKGENCHLCGALAANARNFQKRYFLHCEECDLVFVPGAHHLSADEAKARYLCHRNTLDDAGYVALLRAVIEVLQQHAPQARRVLDYGSGPTPVLTELLRAAGYEATAYDPHFASDKPLTPPGDAIVAVETFEHFAEPRRELKRIVEMLPPGGHLLVQTLLHAGLESFADWWYARDLTHVAFYSARTMEWIARRWGLTIVLDDNPRLTLFRRT